MCICLSHLACSFSLLSELCILIRIERELFAFDRVLSTVKQGWQEGEH